ncbi:MAG: hypothetical protein ACTSRI_01305 [Promethearchaeota archaeon]
MSDKPVTEVHLRNYPKVIFFYPLVFTSLILWIIQAFLPQNESILGAIWFIVFFCNLFVIAFDFSSTKFFILILAIVVVILLIIFLVVPNVTLPTTTITLDLGLPMAFYMIMTLIFAVVLFLVILSSYFNYWKIERNEIYHKSGIFSTAERFPAKSLRIKKEIPDVFEYFALRSGSITLMPGKGDVIHLPTVPNINKKQAQIDHLLSHVSVEPDEVDE